MGSYVQLSCVIGWRLLELVPFWTDVSCIPARGERGPGFRDDGPLRLLDPGTDPVLGSVDLGQTPLEGRGDMGSCVQLSCMMGRRLVELGAFLNRCFLLSRSRRTRSWFPGCPGPLRLLDPGTDPFGVDLGTDPLGGAW